MVIITYYLIVIHILPSRKNKDAKVPVGIVRKVVKCDSYSKLAYFIELLINWLGVKKYELEIKKLTEEEVKEVWGDLPIYEVT